MRSFIRGICCLCTVLTSFVFIAIIEINNTIPTDFYTKTSENFNLNIDNISVSIDLKDNALNVDESFKDVVNYTLKLFNIIPIKNINVKHTEEMYVVPSGRPFGIKIITDGVLVVGESDINTKDGVKQPFKDANIKTGDILLSINDKYIYSNEDIRDIVSNSNGESLKIRFISNNVEKESTIKPELSAEDNIYKIGIWIRDSSAGIGTMTFTLNDNIFAGLGHGVSDVDTNQILPVRKGEIVNVDITNVEKSENGSPGQLKGSFKNTEPIGNIFTNSEIGIYGKLNENATDLTYNNSTAIKFKQDIKKGNAQIITTIDGEGPKVYNIKIDKIDFNKNKVDRNMVIEITDEELLNKTGGIVQGMSGSPIIQNGKIVGALTHVFVNDIKKGYAIFAENMINMANSIK